MYGRKREELEMQLPKLIYQTIPRQTKSGWRKEGELEMQLQKLNHEINKYWEYWKFSYFENKISIVFYGNLVFLFSLKDSSVPL